MVFFSFRTIPEIQLNKGPKVYSKVAPSLSQPEIDKQLAIVRTTPKPIAQKCPSGIGFFHPKFSWEPI